MADDASGEDKPITFHIKTAGDAKYTVTVSLSMTVLSLKELLSTEQYAGLAPERQRLIYSGRVLKDADTLATYKVKEGNTVHMVKTAESNTRNQPGAAPAGNGQGSSSAAGSAPQVPSMAAGTGANNLLAGLTGARFAGLAQLPNQSLFGPDGGMGAPDPEEAIRRLEDPETRRQLNEMLSNPDVLNEMLRHNPMLANMPPGYREMLQPMIREMMTNPDMMRQSLRAQQAMAGGGPGRGSAGSGFAAPGGVDGGEGSANQGGEGGSQGEGQQAGGQAPPPPNPFLGMFPPGLAGAGGAGGAGADNPFLSLLNPNMFGGTQGQGGEGNRDGAAAPPNPFGSMFNDPATQNMMRNVLNDRNLMQQMMRSMYGPPPQHTAGGDATGGEGGSGTEGQTQGQTPGQGQVPVNPFNALFGGAGGMFGQSAAPPDNRPPEERYADQLRQLNDMGFYDFNRNVEALRRSGGSVQGAINDLLGG